MSAPKSPLNILSIIATISTIVGTILAIISTFFPEIVNNAAKQAIGGIAPYLSTDSAVRPSIVAPQIKVFNITAIILITLGAFVLAGFYFLITSINSRAVVTGNKERKWPRYIMLIVVFAFSLLFGITIPSAIFNPTNIETLTIDFGLGAWALKSWIGGLVLGTISYCISFIFAIAIYLASVKLPKLLKSKKFEKAIP